MSRYRGPRLRIIRRLGELPGFTKKTTNRPNPPGQHGMLPKKPSQYGIRLKEKQKLRYNYGISERQLIRYVRQARQMKGSTGENLLQLLEMRLDNIVFRLGFTPTIASARQIISHGHILVNNGKVTIPSFQCLPNMAISVIKRKESRDLINRFLESVDQAIIPPHLSLNKENFTGMVNNLVNRQSVTLNLNELLIIEFYSRKI